MSEPLPPYVRGNRDGLRSFAAELGQLADAWERDRDRARASADAHPRVVAPVLVAARAAERVSWYRELQRRAEQASLALPEDPEAGAGAAADGPRGLLPPFCQTCERRPALYEGGPCAECRAALPTALRRVIPNATALLSELCRVRAEAGIALFLDGPEDLAELAQAVPWASENALRALAQSESLFLTVQDEANARRCFEATVGGGGPTRSNPYAGPCRVLAVLIGPDGTVRSENT